MATLLEISIEIQDIKVRCFLIKNEIQQSYRIIPTNLGNIGNKEAKQLIGLWVCKK
jgi:hypothetical protein